MNKYWSLARFLFISLCVIVAFVVEWCGGSGSNKNTKNQLVINVAGYILEYNGNVKLWKVPLKTDDLSEIIDLYQEDWDDVWYRDSLLIAEKYSQWLWMNVFSRENLDELEQQWLTLSDIDRIQIPLKKKSENMNAVLLDYKITDWFISEVPLLYVSQLFIPDGYNVKLVSFITENSSSHSYAVDMLKSIK